MQVRLFDAFNYVGNGQILFWTGGTWWCALLCGDGLFMLLFALHAEYMSSTVRPHFSLLPQLLLVTTRHAGERKEQGLALRQEQSGCSRFRSFLYASMPFGVCFSFSAAAAGFVQDSIKNCQKNSFPESLFCSFFWSNQVSQTISRTITKR